jgi:aldehyde dehydrogenase (NAD+)
MMMIGDFSDTQIKDIYKKQRLAFDNGETRSYEFRIHYLKKLKASILAHEADIISAVGKDFSKPSYDAFISEVGVTLNELSYFISNLKSLMRPKNVSTPMSLLPASTKLYHDPKGVVAIFSPWNYPFNLAMIPLVGAIAAGNCVMLKVAHETPHTALIIEKIVSETFAPEHAAVIQGNGRVIGQLMFDHCYFNHVFFTGSATVGKWIMAQAAKTLTPITLELGGKSPTIIDKSANLETAAKRIVWSKFFNCGQTCVAPDYLLVHKDIEEAFIAKMKSQIVNYFGNDPSKSEHYARMVNTERYDRVASFLDDGNIVVVGGLTDRSTNYIAPTVVKVVNLDQPIMQEEIFGPILPIVTWQEKTELLSFIRKNRYPLTCYIYSEDSDINQFVIKNVEFGSGCVNDSIAHFANHLIPFGGVQTSGIGKYHGHSSFNTFTNAKPIMSSPSKIELPFRYAPFTKWKWIVAKFFLK